MRSSSQHQHQQHSPCNPHASSNWFSSGVRGVSGQQPHGAMNSGTGHGSDAVASAAPSASPYPSAAASHQDRARQIKMQLLHVQLIQVRLLRKRVLDGASAAPSAASPYLSEVAAAAPEYRSAAALAASLGAPSVEEAENIRVRLLGPDLAARSAYYDGIKQAADCSDEEVVQRAHSASASSDDDLEGFAQVGAREDSPAVEDVKKQDPIVAPPTTLLHPLPVAVAASAAVASCSSGQLPVASASSSSSSMHVPPPPPPPVAGYSFVSLESVECAHAVAPEGSTGDEDRRKWRREH